jgi:hypothetical protein
MWSSRSFRHTICSPLISPKPTDPYYPNMRTNFPHPSSSAPSPPARQLQASSPTTHTQAPTSSPTPYRLCMLCVWERFRTCYVISMDLLGELNKSFPKHAVGVSWKFWGNIHQFSIQLPYDGNARIRGHVAMRVRCRHGLRHGSGHMASVSSAVASSIWS